MTRAEYEAKYGAPPPVSSAPVKMTRQQYMEKYGAGGNFLSPFNPKSPNSQFTNPNAPGVNTGTKHNLAKVLGLSKDSYAPIPNPKDIVTSTTKPFVKGLVSAGRSVQATPDILRGDLAEANKTMAKPANLPGFGPTKPLQGSTTGENLATAAEAGSFLLPKVLPKVKGKLMPGKQEVLKDSLSVVKPQLTTLEEAAAKTAGRGKTTGFLSKKVEIAPSVQELEMADVATQSGVKSSHTFDKNIQLMKDFQRKSAVKVRAGLQDSKAIWNKNELKGVLNKIEEPISISQPDLPIAKKLKDGILKLVDGANKKPEGILDVRQQFDDLVEKNFGKKIFAKDDPKGILIRRYRQALNDFAERKLPDGQLADGSTLKAELRKQTLLYEAIENVATKAPKVGESGRPFVGKIKAFAKGHPTATKVGGAFLGGAAATEIARRILR